MDATATSWNQASDSTPDCFVSMAVHSLHWQVVEGDQWAGKQLDWQR